MNYTAVVVTITDRGYIIPTFILILSLRYYKVQAQIHVLCVDLTEEEKQLFTQFDDVVVFDADLSNKRNPTTRKAEAILTVTNKDIKLISLFDGDCIVTGDITHLLKQDTPSLSARFKSRKEDGWVFSKYYEEGDEYGYIPKKILDEWQRHVGELEKPSRKNTVAGGNLAVHTDYLWFIKKWHEQMMQILPNYNTGVAYDYKLTAYSQLDESILNSLLTFSEEVPPLTAGWFDKDPDAFLAHLGPGNPRYWKRFPKSKLVYLDKILMFIDWGKNENYKFPKLSWTLNAKLKWVIKFVAHLFELKVIAKRIVKKILVLRHIRKYQENI